MQEVIDIVHFHNCKGGGVLSVIKNLLEFSENPFVKNHVIFTNNILNEPDYKVPEMKGASSVQLFKYSPHWNFYYTCRQLKKLLPSENAVIVAHDWLELGMVSNLGLKNPSVQFLHGDYDYYYELAVKNKVAIDIFIPVAKNISEKLEGLLPEREKDISYLRFPVPAAPDNKNRTPEMSNIIFIGPLCDDKGYDLLPQIASVLKKNMPAAHWHIVGAGKSAVKWEEGIEVTFYGEITHEEIMQLLTGMNFILLPSKAEGMPVVITEAMKAGVIPLVSDIEGGIQELVINDVTGYKISLNDVAGYTDKIIYLTGNTEHAEKIRLQCIKISNDLFEPYRNTRLIEEVILKIIPNPNMRAHKVYGSRLDQKWIPGAVTNFIRKNTGN